MQDVWLKQPMLCCCYYEVTTTVVTVLCSYYFLRTVMFAAGRKRRLWPQASVSISPVGNSSFSAAAGQWENGIKMACPGTDFLQVLSHKCLVTAAMMGMNWGWRTRVRGETWQHFTCMQQGAGLFHAEPAAQISLKRSQGERCFDVTQAFLLRYRLEDCKARKSKNIVSRER